MIAKIALPLLLAASLARADEPTSVPPEEPRVKATAFALPHPDVGEATMVEIMRGVESGLRKNARLEMKELDTRLADFAQENPNDQIEAARTALKEGQRALAELRVPDAVEKLKQAVAGLAQVLPFIKKQELADAMANLAVAKYESGDKKGGHEAFVELLTWRPDYAYDPAKLPPQFTGEFDEAQRQVEKAKKMPIVIRSIPPGAQAYIDGKYIGITPCTAEGQPVGKHFVTLKREGYKKAVAPVVVTKKVFAQAEVTLDRSEKYLLVEQARAKVETTLGAEMIDPEAENLKAVLYIEHAVFVRASAAPGGKVNVDAWLYDLRTRHRLSHVHQVMGAGGVAQQAAALAHSLYANVSYEGELLAPVEPPPPPSNIKPAYKTWWFWLALGAGAVVVAGGAVGAWYGISSQTPSCPGGNRCASFQP